MRLEQLQYLLDLTKTNSITQTADKYFISHQALSKSIKAMEKELNVTLLDRSSTGVTLTDAGQRVAQFAKNVIQERQQLEQDLLPYRSTTQPLIEGDITLYVIPRYITPPFLTFIEKMNLSYPKLNIRLHTVTAESIYTTIQFNDTTIALANTCSSFNGTLLSSFQTRNLTYQIFDEQQLYACVHNKSIIAHKKFFTDEDAQTCPFVSFTYTSYVPIEDAYSPNFVFDNFEQQKSFLKHGNCFGRYTKSEYELFFSKNYVLIPFKKPPVMKFVTIYLKESFAYYRFFSTTLFPFQ